MPTKSVFASKTVWGLIVTALGALAPMVLPLVGLEIGDLNKLIEAFGIVLALIGRLSADKPLSLKGG